MGAATGIRAADACSPARTFWVLEKAEAQPPDALLDAAMWPQSGQLSPRVVSLRAPGSDAWVRLEYQP